MYLEQLSNAFGVSSVEGDVRKILKLTDFVAKMDSPAWRQKPANFRANCPDRQTR